MQETKYLNVAKPQNGRRFVISDVHGCSKTFKALLKQIELKKEDQLFLLGDMVNRGPNSHKVLNRILKLKEKGFQLFYIRGNHEQLVLNTLKKTPGQRKRSLNAGKSQNLLVNGELKESYIKLIEESLHYIDTKDYYLVHAGFNFKLDDPFKHSYSMLNIRYFKPKKKLIGKRKIVIGHQPKSLFQITKRIKKNKRKIYIDNGCVNNDIEGLGNLICLNLDTLEINIQQNLDK